MYYWCLGHDSLSVRAVKFQTVNSWVLCCFHFSPLLPGDMSNIIFGLIDCISNVTDDNVSHSQQFVVNLFLRQDLLSLLWSAKTDKSLFIFLTRGELLRIDQEQCRSLTVSTEHRVVIHPVEIRMETYTNGHVQVIMSPLTVNISRYWRVCVSI